MPFRRWFAAATLSAVLVIAGSFPAVGLTQQGPPPPESEQAVDQDRFDQPHRRYRPHGPSHVDGPRGGPRDRMLTDEQVEERLAILEKVHPRLAERLRQTDTERARHMLRRHWRLGNLLRMKQHDPEGFELRVEDMRLERQGRELGRQIRAGDWPKDSDRGKQACQELRELVARHFEVRQTIRAHELAKLDRRIKELKTAIGQRIEKKDQIIEDQYEQLIGESKRAIW